MTRTAVVTTTISRSVDSFYGQIIDDLRARGYRVVVVTSTGPEVPRLRTRADAVGTRIVDGETLLTSRTQKLDHAR